MAQLVRLPDHESTMPPEEFAGADHPMRKVTRGVAFDGAWNGERARKVAELFDGMAPEWSDRDGATRWIAPLHDALDRGGLPLDGEWIELGSGRGVAAAAIVERAGSLVCTDLAAEMLRLAEDSAPRFRSDASQLPVPDDAFDVVVAINMLLFPGEVDRVLRPDGSLLWINSNGEQTPIHLPPEDVIAVLPGDWGGTTARAGNGFWLVARRATEG